MVEHLDKIVSQKIVGSSMLHKDRLGNVTVLLPANEDIIAEMQLAKEEIDNSSKNLETIINKEFTINGLTFNIRNVVIFGEFDGTITDSNKHVIKSFFTQDEQYVIPARYNLEDHTSSIGLAFTYDYKELMKYYYGIIGKPKYIIVIKTKYKFYAEQCRELRAKAG